MRAPYDEIIAQLEAGRNLLRAASAQITPRIAPQTAKKIRSALKSLDGSLRNAYGHQAREGR